MSMYKSMQIKRLIPLAALCAAFAILCGTANAASRIKDLTDIEGIRDNQLIGYGLVVGLNGTGDGLNNSLKQNQPKRCQFCKL